MPLVTVPTAAALPSCSIPALNTYEDVNKPEPPALPKPKVENLPPLPRDEQHLDINSEIQQTYQKVDFDDHDSYHEKSRDNRRSRQENEEENWDELVGTVPKKYESKRERSHSPDRRYSSYERDRRHNSRKHDHRSERSRDRRHRRRSPSDYYERDRRPSHRDHRHRRGNYREYDDYNKSNYYPSMPYDATYNYSHYAAQYQYNAVPGHQYNWQPPPPTDKRLEDIPAPPPIPPPPPPPADDQEEENWDDLVGGPESAANTSVSNEEMKEKVEDEEESNLDLDTRIAMMFKGKSLGAAPPFLQLDSEDEESDKAIVQENQNNQTSEKPTDDHKNGETRPCGGTSPKTTKAAKEKLDAKSNNSNNNNKNIKRERKSIKAEGASDISSSDDELLAKISPEGSLADTKLEEEMSLSSLSSTNSKTEEMKQVEPTLTSTNPYYPGAPGYIYASTNAPYPYNAPYNYGYNPYQFMGAYGAQYMAGFSVPNYSQQKPQEDGDPYEKTIGQVLERMAEELKHILKKDFNKRMIEG